MGSALFVDYITRIQAGVRQQPPGHLRSDERSNGKLFEPHSVGNLARG